MPYLNSQRDQRDVLDVVDVEIRVVGEHWAVKFPGQSSQLVVRLKDAPHHRDSAVAHSVHENLLEVQREQRDGCIGVYLLDHGNLVAQPGANGPQLALLVPAVHEHIGPNVALGQNLEELHHGAVEVVVVAAEGGVAPGDILVQIAAQVVAIDDQRRGVQLVRLKVDLRALRYVTGQAADSHFPGACLFSQFSIYLFCTNFKSVLIVMSVCSAILSMYISIL